MATGEASLIALAGFLASIALGWGAVHGVRLGFDYMSTRGNPRNRAQAHESGRDILLGWVIVACAIGTTAAQVFGLIKF